MYTVHDIDKKTHCPWCREKFKGEPGMHLHSQHLADCFWKYYPEKSKKIIPTVRPQINESLPQKRQKIAEDEDIIEAVPSFLANKCCESFDSLKEKRQFLGRTKIPRVSEYFYKSFAHRQFWNESWFQTNPTSDLPKFTEACGLGTDAPLLIDKFQKLGESVKWYHLCVNADAFESFYQSVSMERGKVGLLPFWCLCDGTSNRGKRRRRNVHHKHCILVSSDNGRPFQRLWKRVKSKGVGACKRMKLIKNLHHFTNTLNYVGRTRSKCQGLEKDLGILGQRHYFINRPFPQHARLFLRMCYPGGVERYLVERHTKEYVYKYKTLKLIRDRNRQWKWSVLVKELTNNEPRFCTVPILQGKLWSLKDCIDDTFDLKVLNSMEHLYHQLPKCQQRCGDEVSACREMEKKALKSDMENEKKVLQARVESLSKSLGEEKDRVKDLQSKNDCLQLRVNFAVEKEGMFREKEELFRVIEKVLREKEELWRMIKGILEQSKSDIMCILKSKDEMRVEIINLLKEKMTQMCQVIQTFVEKYEQIDKAHKKWVY